MSSLTFVNPTNQPPYLDVTSDFVNSTTQPPHIGINHEIIYIMNMPPYLDVNSDFSKHGGTFFPQISRVLDIITTLPAPAWVTTPIEGSQRQVFLGLGLHVMAIY